MSTEITITSTTIDINVSEYPITIEAPSGAYPLPTSVYSVFGRTGNVVAAEGDYTLTQLAGVTITSPSAGQALVYNGTSWVNNTETYVGTVTSVAATVPTGLTISGSPITTSGTLAFGLQNGYSIPTSASQTTWDAAYNDKINSAAVTGTTTKTLTLNQQDGGTITASWSDLQPVTSVFGRTGAITAQNGDYNTLQVTENTNLYFTDQRARYAISGDTTSGVVYSNTTGIIALDDIPNTSLLHDSVTVNGSTVALGGSTSFTTSAVAEGTNLYYTQARFNTAFAAKSTTDLAEGTNLYFTNARAQAAISGTSPISVTSGNVSISQANGSIDGYLSSSDWTTFNSKQGALTLTTTGSSGSATLVSNTLNIPTYTLSGLGGIGYTDLSASSPLSYNNTTGAFSIQVANSSQAGYLTATDWSTFNGKQAALNGTGFVKISGTTISYDNSTYLTTIEGITAGGELSGTYASPSLVNSAVTGKVLTGVNITGGTIQATDSILTAFGKVQNQINSLVGGSIYKGVWNASTNNPSLASGVGTAGWYYIVNVAGSTNLDGITDWNVGDWAIFDGTAWQQVDNTDAVVSVNGFTGAVSLTTSNISEGTNLYYTDARARGSLSAGTGISYNSTSGVVTNSAPDQTVSLSGGTGISTSGTYPSFTITNTAPDQTVSLTGSGTTSISGSYPNFTITSNDQYVGTVTSVGITESSAALSITGSPVTTSGNINIGFAGSSTQYVAGDGSLVTFPTSITEASNLVTEVYNSSGATLTKGTVVYINGGQGNLPTVIKAQANNDTNSAQTYGMVQSDITNNNNGYVVVIGNVMDLDTQAYAAGTQLYLSPTTAGEYTSTKQYAPNHLVYVGIVVRSHPTQGVIEVKIQNGYEMDELHNVSAQSPNNGDILQYVSSTSLWTKTAGTTSAIAEGSNLYYTDARARSAVSLTTTGNSGASTYNSTTGVFNVPTYTLAGLGGINLTSLSATSPLAYNNTTGVFSIQQASGSQAGYLSSTDWTTFNSKQAALTNPVTGTGTTNYLSKFTGTNTIGNSLIWDNGTNVGIGNTNTSYTLDVTGTGRFTSTLLVSGGATLSGTETTLNFNPQTNLLASYYYLNFGGGCIMYRNAPDIYIGSNSKYGSAGTTIANYTSANGMGMLTMDGGNLNYQANATSVTAGTVYSMPIRFTINGSGNVGIGTSSPAGKVDIAAGTGANILIAADATNLVSINNYSSASGFQDLKIVGANQLFFTGTAGGGSVTERMRITSGGDVLIGASSFSGVGGSTIGLEVAGVNAQFLLNNTSYNHFTIYSASDSNIYNIFGTSGNLLFGTGNKDTSSFSEKMRITSGGNVGIGTSDLIAKFAISGIVNKSAPLTYVSSEGRMAMFNSYYSNSEGLFPQYLDILSYGSPDGTNGGSIIRFLTNPVTTGSAAVERMRITSGGDVCFGKTVYDNSTTGVSIADTKTTAIVSVVTDAGVSILCNRKTSTGDIVVFRYNGSGVGSISTNGSTTSYNITSDYRLKEDLKEINGLEKVCAIKVYDFKWKNSENRMDGVLAHELEQILPYAVNGDKDAIDEDGNIAAQGVDYSKLVPILIKAIQEQQAIITSLQDRLDKAGL